jgi:hypothetical protein
MKMVGAGRAKLQGSLASGEVPAVGDGPLPPADDDPDGPAVFDQDFG